MTTALRLFQFGSRGRITFSGRTGTVRLTYPNGSYYVVVDDAGNPQHVSAAHLEPHKED